MDRELLALLDEDGHVVGAAPRGEVRRRNLRHAATAVLVRDGRGRVYLHRRTPDKDLFPGRYDVWAGGVRPRRRGSGGGRATGAR